MGASETIATALKTAGFKDIKVGRDGKVTCTNDHGVSLTFWADGDDVLLTVQGRRAPVQLGVYGQLADEANLVGDLYVAQSIDREWIEDNDFT